MINLNEILANDDNPDHLFFKPGFTYRVKLAVGNDCNMWVEKTQLVTVTCCQDFTPDPDFNLVADPDSFEDDHFAIEAVGYDLHEEFSPVHEWYLFTSPNPNSGPYTPIDIVIGDQFYYEPVAYNIYNHVIHRVVTECGEYCDRTYENNGGRPGRSGSRHSDSEPDACTLIHTIFPSCQNLGAPTNLSSDNGVLSWTPVVDAIEYIVEGRIGGLTSCNCGGPVPNVFLIGTTTDNSFPIPDWLFDQCFEWTVTVVCAENNTATSQPACYYPPLEGGEAGGGRERRVNNGEIGLLVYPNPASNQLYFYISDQQLLDEDFEVQLLNTAGQVLQYQQYRGGTFNGQFPIDDIANGYYFLRFTSQSGVIQNHKVVIAR